MVKNAISVIIIILPSVFFVGGFNSCKNPILPIVLSAGFAYRYDMIRSTDQNNVYTLEDLTITQSFMKY